MKLNLKFLICVNFRFPDLFVAVDYYAISFISALCVSKHEKLQIVICFEKCGNCKIFPKKFIKIPIFSRSLLFLCTVLVISSTSAIRIFCEYKSLVWPVIGYAYTCQVKNFNLTQPDDSIVKVSGNHLHGMNYNNVKALEIRGQTCHFLPQRIKNFFPNLELLRVVNSQLTVISQNDLKPLTKLRVVQMNGNRLTNLYNDLFDFNHNLIRVDFRSQRIKLIGYNIFDNLRKLSLADFQNCGCIDYMAESGTKGVEELKKEISKFTVKLGAFIAQALNYFHFLQESTANQSKILSRKSKR
jgi:hypothetical protein